MTTDDAQQIVRKVARDHAADHDGGFRLVADIHRIMQSLDMTKRVVFRDLLFDLVSNADPDLWGIALEVLTQEYAPETPDRLVRLLETHQGTTEWKRQVILGLLRLGKTPSASIPFITDHLRDPDLVLLAHLMSTDPNAGLRIASRYFADHALSEPDRTWIRNSIGAFVSTFMRSPHLLMDLIYRTSSIRPSAGREIEKIILEYLSNPWIEETYGEQEVGFLRRSLQSLKSSYQPGS